jgi:asparagine synthase (glutamine-hydrolysing)
MFDEEEAAALTGSSTRNAYSPFSVFADHYAAVAGADPLHRALYVDIKTWLADDLLTKLDRASMACGLEARVPLLAPDFVAYAMRLPAALKLRGLNGKYILKRIMQQRLPPEIIRRRKRGFNAPISIWMRTSMAKEIEDFLNTTESSVLDVKALLLRQLWREHLEGVADHGFKLWTLLSFVLWEKSVLS